MGRESRKTQPSRSVRSKNPVKAVIPDKKVKNVKNQGKKVKKTPIRTRGNHKIKDLLVEYPESSQFERFISPIGCFTMVDVKSHLNSFNI